MYYHVSGINKLLPAQIGGIAFSLKFDGQFSFVRRTSPGFQ